MKKITAKFYSTCAETGARIKKGDSMIYDYSVRKCYSMQSQTAKKFEQGNKEDQAGAMVQANEEAFFDNFCHANNI